MPQVPPEGLCPLRVKSLRTGGPTLALTWPDVSTAACSSPLLPARSLAAMAPGLLPPWQACIAVLPAGCGMPDHAATCHQEVLCSVSTCSFSAWCCACCRQQNQKLQQDTVVAGQHFIVHVLAEQLSLLDQVQVPGCFGCLLCRPLSENTAQCVKDPALPSVCPVLIDTCTCTAIACLQ